MKRRAGDAPHLALGFLLVALGNLVGNFLGGHLSDRLPAPQGLLAFSLVAAGVMALPVLAWAPAVEVSVALGFVSTLVNATGRPALLTMISEVSTEARGAVMGLNITFSSLGWLGVTALGGVVVAMAGFGGLAILTFTFGLDGGGLSVATWLVPRGAARFAPLGLRGNQAQS